MQRYSMPMGRTVGFNHPHPERTAFHSGTGIFSDVFFQVWPNRKSMARSIRMQQRRAHRNEDWRPLVALGDGEGY